MRKINLRSAKFIENYAALIWIGCITTTIAILAIATRLATVDPSFSSGGKEEPYLVPLLILTAIGTITFTIMVLAGVINLLVKKEPHQFKPILGLTTRRILLLTGVLIFGVSSFLFGLRQGSLGMKTTQFSSQDLWEAVNTYRTQNGVKTLTLSQEICFGISDRWKAISNNLINNRPGHEGGENFLQTQRSKGLLTNVEIIELFTEANTPQEALTWWNNSPSHRLGLLDPQVNAGCTFWNYQDERNTLLALLLISR
ncbi:MAG: hypothetical protein HY376_03410 [Candidatus Blackburnbacteria bacterium]|nr:hypothetical protein [Candidatus Blackburnbacteria bacterium]